MERLQEIVMTLILCLFALSVVLYATEQFIGSPLPTDLRKNLTEPMVLTFVGGSSAGAGGPVDVTPYARDDGGYLYEIRATPRILVSGERETAVNIIGVISFKGQSVRAIFANPSGDSDVYTIQPDDEFIDPVLKADIISDIIPLQTFDNTYYSDRFSYKTPVLVRSGRSAIVAGVQVDEKYSLDFAYNLEGYKDCRATFTLTGPCKTYFPFIVLNGTPDSTLSEREQSVELCGGTATVRIFEKPDCSAKRVNAEVSYGCSNRGGQFCGEEWETVGEKVLVDFWKDGPCARRVSDFKQLLAGCKDDWLGWAELNAGCTGNPTKQCFS